MVCSDFELPSRSGSPEFEKERSQETSAFKVSGLDRAAKCSTKPKAKAAVSSEAESRRRNAPSKLSGDEFDARPSEFATLGSLASVPVSHKDGNRLSSAAADPNEVFCEGRHAHLKSFDRTMTMSYPKWCAMLVPLVLKSRTSFGSFVAHTISLSRRMSYRSSSTLALFPVPIHPDVCFDRMPAGLSATKRKRLHLLRAVHVICMALNFWHSDACWADDDSLRREPNQEHFALYRRVASLIRSDGLAESFQLEKSGRKSPELLARLGQLSDMVTAVGNCGANYDRSVPGVAPDEMLSHPDDIVPFSDLDA